MFVEDNIEDMEPIKTRRTLEDVINKYDNKEEDCTREIKNRTSNVDPCDTKTIRILHKWCMLMSRQVTKKDMPIFDDHFKSKYPQAERLPNDKHFIDYDREYASDRPEDVSAQTIALLCSYEYRLIIYMLNSLSDDEIDMTSYVSGIFEINPDEDSVYAFGDFYLGRIHMNVLLDEMTKIAEQCRKATEAIMSVNVGLYQILNKKRNKKINV